MPKVSWFWKICRKRSLLAIIVFLCMVSTLLKPFEINHIRFYHSNINGTCRLPKHDPFDPSIAHYFSPPSPIICMSHPDLLYIDWNNDTILYNRTAFQQVALDWQTTDCEALPFGGDGEFMHTLNISKSVGSLLPSDFALVTCTHSGKVVYKELFYHISGTSKQILQESAVAQSVIIFGIDSVSNLMSKRMLPRTVQYLVNTLKANEMVGYTKMAENSFPNIHTMLTGHGPKPEIFYKDKFVDDTTQFIWTDFSQRGYATLFTEDTPHMSIFNAITKGFRKIPVDHFSWPFFVKSQLQDLHVISKLQKSLFQNEHCLFNKKIHKIQIEFLQRFMTKYKTKRKFAFLWQTGLAHNSPNDLALGDKDFLLFFRWLHEGNHLNNTFVFFISDHGSNINQIRNTPIGRVEERMPMLYLIKPKNFIQDYPKYALSVDQNQDKLTTHADTYETLRQIVMGKAYRPMHSQVPSRISFFQDIPKGRSCFDAGVSSAYCPCFSQVPENTTADHVIKMANSIVNYINAKLSHERQLCSILHLDSIEDAQKTVSQFYHVAGKKSWYQKSFQSSTVKQEQYILLIKTKPGSALFEGTVTMTDSQGIKILDPISRSNKYGNQSHCIRHAHELMPFCFCQDLISP